MILGRDRQRAAACFAEIDAAVEALRPKDAPPIALNAHAFPDELPREAIVYNFENVGTQISPQAFIEHRLWDFSAANMPAWKGRASHVPVGYHASMERFDRVAESEPYVILTGAMNSRRAQIVHELERRRIVVVTVGHDGPYGRERDRLLARARLALNVRFYEDGVFPVLRAAHCVANRVPVLSEATPDAPEWSVLEAGLDDLVETTVRLVSDPARLELAAAHAYGLFVSAPLKLPL